MPLPVKECTAMLRAHSNPSFQISQGVLLRPPAPCSRPLTEGEYKGDSFIPSKKGVTPSVPVELLPDDLLAGQDPQMQKAMEIVREM